jgi:hypothetical protein
MTEINSYFLFDKRHLNRVNLKTNIIFSNDNFILTHHRKILSGDTTCADLGPIADLYSSSLVLSIKDDTFQVGKVRSVDALCEMINILLSQNNLDRHLIDILASTIGMVMNNICSSDYSVAIEKNSSIDNLKLVTESITYSKDIGEIDEETKYKTIVAYRKELKKHIIFNDSRDDDIFNMQLKNKLNTFINNYLDHIKEKII